MNVIPFKKTPREKLKASIFKKIKDRKERQHLFSVISVIFLFLAIFVGIFIGLLQNQEVRKKASEVTRKAEIVLVPSSTPLRADTLSTVFVRLNTHGEEVDGLQVVFDLLTNTTDDVSVRIKQGTGLRSAWDKVESIEGGKKVSFAAITSDPYAPFSSDQPVDIAEISFVAGRPGNLALVFDGFSTKANRHQQLKNVLKPIIIQEYQIASAPTPVPNPKVVSTIKPATSSAIIPDAKMINATKGQDKLATDSVRATITITSNTNTSNLAGGDEQVAAVEGGICNEPCQSSVECGSGFLCYENQCRLSTNLTSNICKDIAQRSKSCNERCNQSLECKTGLTCFDGSCRDITNPVSEVCQNDQTVVANINTNCGKECGVNADCGGSLSCSDGLCRLATNPESPNCLQQEVVIKNLGNTDQDDGFVKIPAGVDQESSLSLLTQILMALALTVVIGITGAIAYSYIKGRSNKMEL